ncbi:hypothetical protein D3C87_1304120 [compost metagenome]
MVVIKSVKPDDVTHIIPITIIRRTPIPVVPIPCAMLPDVFRNLGQIHIRCIAGRDGFAVGLVVARAIEENADPQGNSLHLDLFFLFLQLSPFFLGQWRRHDGRQQAGSGPHQ